MNLFSVLAFHAMDAMRQRTGMSFVQEQPASSLRQRPAAAFKLVGVVVASKDALLARRALLSCPGASILRCVPTHRGRTVKLEVRFPEDRADEVFGRIMASLPCAEIGAVVACGGTGHDGMSRRGGGTLALRLSEARPTHG